MIAALVAALALAGAEVAALVWAARAIRELGVSRAASDHAAAMAAMDLSTERVARERAEFERDTITRAHHDQAVRIAALEETIAEVLAAQPPGAGLAPDDAVGRVRRRIAEYRTSHPSGDLTGGAVPSSSTARPVSVVGSSQPSGATGDMSRGDGRL